MASYQDIESRLRTVEDKIDFVLKTFTVTRAEQSLLVPGQVITTSMTLLDVYREMKTQGAVILPFGTKAQDIPDLTTSKDTSDDASAAASAQ